MTLDVETPEDVSVRANELLGRALRNVLSNAVEHSGAEPAVEVRVRTNAEYGHVDVADDGRGIPAEERQRVLEPSERGLESDGESLGLFLARSIVEQYGGHIDIADNEPTGAVVTLSVPRADADPEKIPAQ